MPPSRRSIVPTRRWRGTHALVAVTLLASALPASSPRLAHAATFTVTKTADTNDGVCDGDCSLREAILTANASPGPDTITLPAGTYQLTIAGNEDAASSGDLDITDSLAIVGAGASSTIIDGGDTDRVFDIAPISTCTCTISFSGVTIANGNANASNFNVGGAIYLGFGTTTTITGSVISSSTATGTGGGIEARGAALTLANVTFAANSAVAGGGALRSIGNLNVSTSTFSDNVAEFGGAISLGQDSTKTVSITGSRFTGNDAVTTAGGAADDGGAIHANVDTVVTLTGSTLTGNTAANNGGAISFTDNPAAGTGTLNASFNRITGNAATAGSGLAHVSGVATAENNWWGCNAGPTSAPCDRVQGAADADPWLQLVHTADPSTIDTGGASTLTAGFLTNSAGSAVSAANLGAIIGVPVLFDDPVLGTLSGAQTAIQSSGTATATFTAGGTGGTGSANATVDAEEETASITIVAAGPTTAVTSISRAEASPTNAATVTWTVAFDDPVSGLSAGNFSLASAGLGGAPQITSVTPSSTAPTATWTVTASTGSGAGTLGLNLTDDAGLSHSLTNLPFDGQVYSVDRVAPDTTITANPTNTSNSSSASFSFSGSDTGVGVTGFECELDGGGFQACTSPQNYTGLADGSHTFQVRASDGAGNLDLTPATFTWTIDATGPDTTIDSSPANPSNSGSASFTFSGTDGGSGVASFECQIDGGGFGACTSPQGYTGLADGSHTFEVRAIDGGGTPDPTPAAYTWTVDTTAPSVAIEQATGQSDPAAASPIYFTATFSEPVTGFGGDQVTLSGTAGATTAVVTGGPTVYNVAVSGMTASGTVVATIEANEVFDAAGNPNTASTSTDNTVTFEADTNVVPTVAVTGGQCSSTNLVNGTLHLTLADVDLDPLTLTLGSNSNPTLVPTGNIIIGGGGVNRSVTITAAMGRSGSAMITLNISDGTVTVPFSFGVRVGTDRSEVLAGTSMVDMIFGRGGTNTIFGKGENDLLCGGNSFDWLLGDDGDDILVGQKGNDALHGGNGADTLRGNAGNDLLTGGPGPDFFSGGSGFDLALDFNFASGDRSDGTIP